MSAITPQTELKLLKCPIESDNRNQINFSNATAQYNYFNSLPKLEVDNFTYQRKDNVIRYPAHIDSILEYNYVMYQNENYTNKWFYAFITNMEYVNDNMTYITIKTDVYQTWQFNMQWKQSFTEREHVNDDYVGQHTIPEDIETGDFIVNSHTVDTNMDNIGSDLCYIVSSAVEIYGAVENNKLPMATGQIYNGIYSGTKFYRFDSAGVAQAAIESLADKGQIDAVNGVFLAPKTLAIRKTTGTQTLFEIEESSGSKNYNISISKNYSNVNGYTPVNKKVLCRLYNYLMVSNNNGNSYVYNYEDFTDSSCTFTVKMAITPGCSIRMTPTRYKGATEADEYSINMGKLPICSFPCDMYTNWLTQNSINVLGTTITSDDLNIGSSVLSGLTSVGSMASGYGGLSGATGVANSLFGIGNAMITKKQHDLIPPQTRGNLNAGDVITSSNKNNFHFYKMSIRYEYAKIIDKYFSMFGYKVNEVKIPNLTGRTNWNYVKTIGANIEGNIPEGDLNEIKSIFNNGVTLWHNPATYLDYSQSNAII